MTDYVQRQEFRRQRLRSESIGRLSMWHRKDKPASIKAHPRLWSVVMFHGDGKGLDSLWQTKAEADAAAQAIGPQAFVLPPINAWAGKDET